MIFFSVLAIKDVETRQKDNADMTSQTENEAFVTSHKDIVTSDEEEEVLYEGREATKV